MKKMKRRDLITQRMKIKRAYEYDYEAGAKRGKMNNQNVRRE